MPYMCCGGTVATACTTAPSGHRPASAARFCSVLARKLRQVLALGFGAPVLPEVKPIARSEEQTSELQSLMRYSYAVFCLKNKKKKKSINEKVTNTRHHNT